MISYRIIFKQPPSELSKSVSSKTPPSEQELRERIFRKSLRSNKKVFHPGAFIRVNKTQYYGTVKEVIDEFKNIKWDNGKPYYIVIEMDSDKKVLICHPSQITKVKAKP